MKTSTFAVFAASALLAATPFFASAAVIQTGQTLSVTDKTPLVENAYFAGRLVNVTATVQKDLVVAGADVTVNGPVWGDTLLAGGIVQILQDVRGDVRVAGGQVTIGNTVHGDLVVLGGTVTLLPDATIDGDVIAAGGRIDLEGAVDGSLRAYGSDVTVNGTIAGPAIIHAAHTAMFGDSAVFKNTLWYSAPAEAAASGAKLGTDVTFVKGETGIPRADNVASIAMAVLGFLVFAKFIGILVVALILVLAFRGFADMLATHTLQSFWKAAGIGFVTLVVVPVGIVVLMLSVVGFYLAFMLGVAYVLALMAGGVYMCILAGALLSHWIKKQYSTHWTWTLLGTVAVFILSFIPFVGWIADALLFLAALGSLVSSFWRAALAKM